MSDQRFDQVHMFIDESGDLNRYRRKSDVLLVGGVLLFGAYDDKLDAKLRQQLRRRLEDVGGTFPTDLHFSGKEGKGLSASSRNEFLRSFDADLRKWCGKDRQAYGVVIRHDQDVFGSSARMLGEQFYDNRYLSMLWSLVENLLFVDEGVRRRLTDNARVHLHIANRGFGFNPEEISAELLESLGYKVTNDEFRPGYKWVKRSLTSRDVATMMRFARRQRWAELSPELGSVDVRGISYRDRESAALMYLADLYLGTVRLNERASRRAPTKMVVLDTLRRLNYSIGLELLAEIQASLVQGNLQRYLDLMSNYHAESMNQDFSPYERIARQQERAAARLVSSPDILARHMEAAAVEVDRPGSSASGVAKAELAQRLMDLAQVDDFRTEILRLQIQLSHANHTGDSAAADEIWCEFLRVECELGRLGGAGLGLRAAIRNRRAVSLTDQFRYDEAMDALTEIISDREELLSTLAAMYEIPASDMPEQPLGECLGTLGQLHCFIGTPASLETAESCFRRAQTLFVLDEKDIERQWVYLGHLACDRGVTGRELWKEVCRAVPGLSSPDLMAEPGSQYKLALQLKGMLVFFDDAQLDSAITKLASSEPLNAYTAEDRRHHPFGLIYQSLGLLYARHWRQAKSADSGQATLEHFDSAIRQLQEGGGVLRLLYYIASLRREVFLLEMVPKDRSAKTRLRKILAALKGYAMESFVDDLWSEDDEGRETGIWGGKIVPADEEHSLSERAQSVISAVRFNYW